MNELERLFWLRAHRRISGLTPEIQTALERALRIIRDSMSETELADIIEAGDFDTLLGEVLSDTLIDRATIQYRTRLRRVVDRSFGYATADLPRGGMIDGTIGVMFDHLSPNVITAIRALDTRVMSNLAMDVREVVRAFVENGLRDGVNPRTIARGIRSVIGLGPSQLQEVQNYRDALNGVNGRQVSSYTLRDKRLKPKTPEQIDKAVETYKRRRIALNAETNARTATLDAFKQGQRLAWDDAIAKGIVDPDRLMHQWIGVNDARERPEHVLMNNEVQPYAQRYSNGQLVPGESEYNCRCLDRFYVARAAA